jgi:hypothetical protein
MARPNGEIMDRARHWGIAPESGLLAALCVADLVSTLWLVYGHGAREANPVMDFYLALGPLAFALAKTLTFMAPIVVLEILRRRRPESIRAILRLAIVSYVVCYGVGLWHVNSRTQVALASEPSSQSEEWR